MAARLAWRRAFSRRQRCQVGHHNDLVRSCHGLPADCRLGRLAERAAAPLAVSDDHGPGGAHRGRRIGDPSRVLARRGGLDLDRHDPRHRLSTGGARLPAGLPAVRRRDAGRSCRIATPTAFGLDARHLGGGRLDGDRRRRPVAACPRPGHTAFHALGNCVRRLDQPDRSDRSSCCCSRWAAVKADGSHPPGRGVVQ